MSLLAQPRAGREAASHAQLLMRAVNPFLPPGVHELSALYEG